MAPRFQLFTVYVPTEVIDPQFRRPFIGTLIDMLAVNLASMGLRPPYSRASVDIHLQKELGTFAVIIGFWCNERLLLPAPRGTGE